MNVEEFGIDLEMETDVGPDIFPLTSADVSGKISGPTSVSISKSIPNSSTFICASNSVPQLPFPVPIRLKALLFLIMEASLRSFIRHLLVIQSGLTGLSTILIQEKKRKFF